MKSSEATSWLLYVSELLWDSVRPAANRELGATQSVLLAKFVQYLIPLCVAVKLMFCQCSLCHTSCQTCNFRHSYRWMLPVSWFMICMHGVTFKILCLMSIWSPFTEPLSTSSLFSLLIHWAVSTHTTMLSPSSRGTCRLHAKVTEVVVIMATW